ncbi:MAG: hypothetical protein APF76_01935 [Desulfitibacter sp. BRH_c19]|nr:MAG: hypothetical protein APF76_01935 [Desulfitibacter sp. BRH_c19]
MKKVLFGIFLLGIIITSVIYYQQIQGVSYLTDSDISASDFAQMLQQEQEFYVYFYSPTCTECQAAEPKIIEAIKGKQIELVKINILENEDLFNQYKRQFDLPGVPVILHFESGEATGGVAGSPEDAEVYEEFFEER